MVLVVVCHTVKKRCPLITSMRLCPDRTKAGYHVPFQVAIWAMLMLLQVGEAHASSALQGLICDLVDLVQGDMGKAAASISILVLGFQCALGRLSWAVPFTLAGGLALLFSAGKIAELFTGVANPC